MIKNWIFSIIGPTPQEIFLRIEFVPFIFEGVLILIFPFLIYFYSLTQTYLNKKLFNKIFFYSIITTLILLITIHAPFGILNPGTGIRWRVNFECIFYLLPFLIYIKCIKDSKS